MSEWITWSPCSVSCGMGTRSRERYVKQFPEDGSICTLPTEETEKCTVNEDCCENTQHMLETHTHKHTHTFLPSQLRAHTVRPPAPWRHSFLLKCLQSLYRIRSDFVKAADLCHKPAHDLTLSKEHWDWQHSVRKTWQADEEVKGRESWSYNLLYSIWL